MTQEILTANPPSISQLGDPVLRAVAEPFGPELFGTPELRAFGALLVRTMSGSGVGLAAPQIGVSRRIISIGDPIQLEALDEAQRAVWAEKERAPFEPMVLVNPEIVAASAEQADFFEGCLSLNGYTAMVRRARQVVVAWRDVEGERHEQEFTGWPARILQHEIDHLDGIFYTDRMEPRSLMTSAHFEKRFKTALIADIKAALGV